MPTELPIAGIGIAGSSAFALSSRFEGRPLMWWGAAGMLGQAVYHFLRSMKEHAFTGAALRAALHEAGVSTRGFSAVGGGREVLVSLALPAPRLLAPWGCRRTRVPYWRFHDGRAALDMEVVCTPLPRGAPLRGVLLHFTSWSWAVSSRGVGSRPLVMQAAAAGWVVMLPHPRTIPSVIWPQPLTDAKRALAWCKLHCRLWGGDPRRVVACGDSTGGHVALMLGLTANAPALQRGTQGVDTSVAGVVAIHPVVDLTDSGDSMAQRDPSRSGFQLLQLLLRRRYARTRAPFVLASPLHHVLGPEHLSREQNRSVKAANAASTSAGAAARASLHCAVHSAVLPGALDPRRQNAAGVAHRSFASAQRFVMQYALGVPVCEKAHAPLGGGSDSDLLQLAADENAAAASSWGGRRTPVVPPLHTVMGGVSTPSAQPYLSSIVQPTAVFRHRNGSYSVDPELQRVTHAPLGEGAGGGSADQSDFQVQVPPVLPRQVRPRPHGPMSGSVPAGKATHVHGSAALPAMPSMGGGTASGQLVMLGGARAPEECPAPLMGGGMRGAPVPPCLLVHGSNDCVVPPEEALRFWHALKLRRVADACKHPPQDCLMLLPGGGHFFSCIPSHRTLASGRGILHWASAVTAVRGSALADAPPRVDGDLQAQVESHAAPEAKL